MNEPHGQGLPPAKHPKRFGWFKTVCAAWLLLIVVAMFWRTEDDKAGTDGATMSGSGQVSDADSPDLAPPLERTRRAFRVSAPTPTAEEVVATKLNQFVRSRRELAHAMARHYNIQVPADVERFFDAVEARRWDEMKALFATMRERMKSESGSLELAKLWPAIHETLGVAQEVQKWPAQRLLDYGNSILNSLRPGMVYVGGTDPGRFIPTLLNETSEGQRHIVLTQNALADSSYLEYLNFLSPDGFAALGKDDSQRAFQEYIEDAKRRYQHDQQFPDEPKQIRPGEDIQMIDNRVQVSGQVAVMSINEKLLKMLMNKNPEVSFAIEQSFPFTSMYGDTKPLGPIMELRVQDGQSPVTPESAAESLDYWRTAARELADSTAADTDAVRMTYGKMAAEQAALLLHHGHTAAAEEALRFATEIGPASPEAVFRYVDLLVGQNRFTDAIPILETATRVNPENQQFRDLLTHLQTKQKN